MASCASQVRQFQTSATQRDIDQAAKYIGAGAATVGVAGSGTCSAALMSVALCPEQPTTFINKPYYHHLPVRSPELTWVRSGLVGQSHYFVRAIYDAFNDFAMLAARLYGCFGNCVLLRAGKSTPVMYLSKSTSNCNVLESFYC